jgi:hypothetical protein
MAHGQPLNYATEPSGFHGAAYGNHSELYSNRLLAQLLASGGLSRSGHQRCRFLLIAGFSAARIRPQGIEIVLFVIACMGFFLSTGFIT